MELLLIVFLIASVLLWGFFAVIWKTNSNFNLFLKIVSIGMTVSALLLMLGTLGMVVVL